MKLWLHYWTFSHPSAPAAIAPTLAETARVADQAGFAGFTVLDHFFQMDATAPAEEPMLEGYTTLVAWRADLDRHARRTGDTASADLVPASPGWHSKPSTPAPTPSARS